MYKSSYQVAHKLLLNEGYRRKPSYDGRHYYQADLDVQGKKFGIELSFCSLDFINLPVIKIKKWPKGLPERLPHVDSDGVLCYLDHEYIYLDRYNLKNSLYAILSSLNNLLTMYVNKDSAFMEGDFADEFTAYWKGDSSIFVRHLGSSPTLSFFNRYSILSGANLITEGIVYSS